MRNCDKRKELRCEKVHYKLGKLKKFAEGKEFTYNKSWDNNNMPKIGILWGSVKYFEKLRDKI